MPVQSQFRPDPAPPLAAPSAFELLEVCHRRRVGPEVPGSKRSLYSRTSEEMSGAESLSYQPSQLLKILSFLSNFVTVILFKLYNNKIKLVTVEDDF